MPLTMDEYEYLRETMEQVQGLAGLAYERANAETETPLPVDGLPVLLLALGRACDDAIAVAEGMVEAPHKGQ
ncbi:MULTISPECIES: hypothetical protein [unclassified Roseovarius]|uniref:hypothetical protein n=1 Tax=unclassified Roseovarius TaxID=2614913 RepID=UPI00273F3235|nr:MULTISPECIES: hypothetical protein [unclassified Roseovarius]